MSPLSRKRSPILMEHPFVVVGVDGSPASQQALCWALREAHRSGAVVEAVRVWTDPWAITGPPSLVGAGKEGVAKLHEQLADSVQEAREETGLHDVTVVEELLPGSPAEVLLAESEDADLLVVGTRGLNRVGRWLLGSVSHECSLLARVPVVLVPDPAVRPAHLTPLGTTAGATGGTVTPAGPKEPTGAGVVSESPGISAPGLPGSLTPR
jgi:nucleotide-binding universal stress UspA family protein